MIVLYWFKTTTVRLSTIFAHLVLQISRLSEGSTGQIFATSSVIYQMKMLGFKFLKVVDDTSDSEY